MAPPQPSALLEKLLPAGVATAELTGSGDPELLLPVERRMLGHAVPMRVREFAAGRICARHAVAQFGFVDCPLGRHEDRRPRWPTRLTGSVTHTEGFCAAAVGERQRFRAIGIDAERIGRVSRELWRHVLVPAEAGWLESLPASAQATVAALMFSAKEAFYKCQYEVTQQWLEFRDIAVEFGDRNLDRNTLAVRPVGNVRLLDNGGAPAMVRFACTSDMVLTAMTISAH